MEVNPVREAKPPKYPRMDEVSLERIKGAVPRRWAANHTAKTVLAALIAPAIAGNAPDSKTEGTEYFSADAGSISITADGRELAAAAIGNTVQETVFPEAYVDPSTATPPMFYIIPYFIAAGAALGIVLWIRRVIRKRKKPAEGAGKIQPAGSKAEQDILVKRAREGLDPISCCGHHCDYCFLREGCGGCRSDYNVCSFATLFEDRQCPNVKCAKEKGIEGCYKCGELESCSKGYYCRENEYVAKATAMFIKRYGKGRYTETLSKAIEGGADYPKTFDETGSVKRALKLLEKYLA